MSKRSLALRACLFSLILEFFAVVLNGQTGVGQIQGTVTDASGAVVPRAGVTLENLRTENRFETTTNESGLYAFPSVAPGEYKLTIAVPGMQKWEGKATLATGQRG